MKLPWTRITLILALYLEILGTIFTVASHHHQTTACCSARSCEETHP